MTVRVGVSGWTYPPWRGDFYPDGLVQRSELAYLADRVDSVEINGSFYSLQRPATYASWVEQTPADFVFAVKGSRYLTHMKRLGDVDAGLANFFASGVLALGAKTGPFLWQLPADLPFDAEVLDRFLGLLPRTTADAARIAGRHDERLSGRERVMLTPAADVELRHALEPRHASFGSDEAAAVMRAHGTACVLADSAGRWPQLDRDTAGFRYVRLHGHTELYASGYRADSLDRWAARCRDWGSAGDVFVYFDNDARGRAPHDAVSLRARLPDAPESS